MKSILFTADNLDKVVRGLKTQTRRLSGLEEVNQEPDKWKGLIQRENSWRFQNKDSGEIIRYYPKYRMGETVYIKEGWCTEKQYDNLPPPQIPVSAHIHFMSDGVGEWPLNLPIGKPRSPMFLREVFARHFIKILGMRPERLQSITEEDAIAEGCAVRSDTGLDTARYRYHVLWDSINGKRHTWSSNPWVWVYTFQLTEPER